MYIQHVECKSERWMTLALTVLQFANTHTHTDHNIIVYSVYMSAHLFAKKDYVQYSTCLTSNIHITSKIYHTVHMNMHNKYYN